MAINWKQLNDILGSKGVETGLGLAGAFLTAKGQGDRADALSAQNNEQFNARLNQDARQFAATLAANANESDRDAKVKAALAVLGATKLGENENFATRNRMLSTIIPNLRNSNMMPGDPRVVAAMGPQQRGPLPEGGIPPEVLRALGEDATAAAIANRARQTLSIDPHSAAPDFKAMGFANANDPAAQLEQHRTERLAADEESKKKMEELLQRALLADYAGEIELPAQKEEKKKGGFLSGLGKVLGIAAPFALGAIPGVGPALGAAFGIGSSLAKPKPRPTYNPYFYDGAPD